RAPRKRPGERGPSAVQDATNPSPAGGTCTGGAGPKRLHRAFGIARVDGAHGSVRRGTRRSAMRPHVSVLLPPLLLVACEQEPTPTAGLCADGPAYAVVETEGEGVDPRRVLYTMHQPGRPLVRAERYVTDDAPDEMSRWVYDDQGRPVHLLGAGPDGQGESVR